MDDENSLEEEKVWGKFSICKVPYYMKKNDSNGVLFSPQIVSIGPYHYGDENLIAMEKHKERASRHFLRKSQRTEADCMESLRTLLPTLQDSYLELDEKWQLDTDGFLRLLVIDGSFLVEILRMQFDDYVSSDPFFRLERFGTIASEKIKRDMLLMENQLPLPVLENLLDGFKQATGNVIDIKSLVLDFFYPGKGATCVNKDCKHILDIVYQSMIGTIGPTTQVPSDSRNPDQQGTIGPTTQVPSDSRNPDQQGTIGPTTQVPSDNRNPDQQGTQITPFNNRSATVLRKAGIKFKLNPTLSINEISFMNSKLNFPGIIIENYSESMFMNLVALDQLHCEVSRDSRPMSSYFWFLSSLITSVEDVRLLRDQEIIKSSIACDATVHQIFTRLGEGLVFGKVDRLGLLREELNHHKNTYKSKVSQWYSTLHERYLDSTWSIIGVGAAAVVLTFTAVGAVYTVFSYYKA